MQWVRVCRSPREVDPKRFSNPQKANILGLLFQGRGTITQTLAQRKLQMTRWSAEPQISFAFGGIGILLGRIWLPMSSGVQA